MIKQEYKLCVMIPGTKTFFVGGIYPEAISRCTPESILDFVFVDAKKLAMLLFKQGVKKDKTGARDKEVICEILSRHTANDRIKMLSDLLKEDIDASVH